MFVIPSISTTKLPSGYIMPLVAYGYLIKSVLKVGGER